MPKILFDVREKLLQAARKSLKENGYQALSVREIARTCGIGTGTVYNYFHSKDELLALVILEDWDDTLKNIDAATALADNFSDGMKSLYEALDSFVALYRATWGEYTGAGGSLDVIARYHRRLRQQISAKIMTFAVRTGCAKAQLCTDLLAETLLAAVMQPDLSFVQLEVMLQWLT